MIADARFLAVRNALVESARTLAGMHSEHEVLAWLDERTAAHQYSVERIPLEVLRGWRVDPTTGDVGHSSGKFFTVAGLDVQVRGATARHWSQPIIVQPEVGILGFIAQRHDGVLHLLVQAKMEPGNVNLVQISPTVQATHSNYSQVHGGRRPLFMEYFVESGRGITLVDQLQSEQGARYLHKRNRNVIILVPDDEVIVVPEDFRWVTLGQLQRLHRHPNVVHLDCRSIIGSLSLVPDPASAATQESTSFGRDVLASLACPDSDAEHAMPEIMGWMTRMKIQHELRAVRIPLEDTHGWHTRSGMIEHELGRFFRIIGVDVRASSREVVSWCQPLIHSVEGGVLALLLQRRGGVPHALVQARLEPGFVDAIEFAPTIQYAPINYGAPLSAPFPPFIEVLERLRADQVRIDTTLSDEGGRFYHSHQRHVVAEIDTDETLDLPENFRWMTLAQLHACVRFSFMLNIELRSLLSCMSLV